MKKNIVKMILDIVMVVILALLYNSHVASMSFHEIAGLGLFGLFVIHCLLNIKWITAISKRFFSKSLSLKVRIGYIVNLLLLVTFIFEIISGIQTSQVLFPADSHGSIWRGIHHFCGAVSIILIGVHLGLHWSFITGMVKKAIRIKSAVIRKVIAMVLLVVVLSFGAYSITTSSFTNWLVEPFVTQTKDPSEHTTNTDLTETETTSDSQTTENSEDEKSGGDMNDHSPKDGENKAPRPSNGTGNASGENGTPKKHDDSTKTVDTNPAIVLGTIAKFISIMGIFAALTYYIGKLSKLKKKEKQ